MGWRSRTGVWQQVQKNTSLFVDRKTNGTWQLLCTWAYAHLSNQSDSISNARDVSPSKFKSTEGFTPRSNAFLRANPNGFKATVCGVASSQTADPPVYLSVTITTPLVKSQGDQAVTPKD